MFLTSSNAQVASHSWDCTYVSATVTHDFIRASTVMNRGRYRSRGGGSSSSYRGGSSSRGGKAGNHGAGIRGLFADGIWLCDCTPRQPAEHFKVKKEGPNKGRWFHTCQAQPDTKRCGFFIWDEQSKLREEAAVLGGKRTEVGGGGRSGEDERQEGWSAGRAQQAVPVSSTPRLMPTGKGLLAQTGGQLQSTKDDDETESPTPTPPASYNVVQKVRPTATAYSNGTKRSARDAGIDNDDEDDFFPWPLTGQETQELAKAADSAVAPPETPH